MTCFLQKNSAFVIQIAYSLFNKLKPIFLKGSFRKQIDPDKIIHGKGLFTTIKS